MAICKVFLLLNEDSLNRRYYDFEKKIVIVMHQVVRIGKDF
jgi:hypothetical protein